ncbi:ImmA/IrrE family metallo-endopeptidase [Micrococcus luteus]|uniref:ImmA/IrrE family metallo-endopeptidase n=1 Tax=Micrococcus luteus TaxID=1270 RepID=UPI003517AF7B
MFQTDYAVPTGDFIEEWLEDHSMTQAELARRTGVSPKHISMVLSGAPVTASFATKLALATGVPAERWLALESTFRADQERLGMEAELAKKKDVAEPFSESLRYLRSIGVVRSNMRRPGQVLMELMAFFRVGSVDALTPKVLIPNARYLQSTSLTVQDASVATWLRLAQMTVEASDPLPPYKSTKLQEALPEIRSMSGTFSTNPDAFIERLSSLGVHVVLQEEIRGCRAYGATFWTNGHPVIVLSVRGKTDGALWFSLFHELGHVLLHPDSTHIERRGKPSLTANLQAEEDAANTFAEQTLIPLECRDDLYSIRSKSEVVAFASEQNVSPGVVMQHLHHFEKWDHSHGRGLYLSISLKETAPLED